MVRSRAAKLLIFVAVVLLLAEVLSKGGLYVFFGITDTNYAHRYGNDPQLDLLTWTDSYTAHPYFGYESPRTIASEKLLSEVGPDDFVIGILGGSVAQNFATYAVGHSRHFEPLRESMPNFGKKTLRIVNLANGGFKQPQQFFVATYFMEKLDVIINIDGFNDPQPAHLLPVYPLEFPLLPRFYGRADQGGVYAMIGGTAKWFYKTMNHAPLVIPGLSRSSLYFICWHYLRNVLYRIVRASESSYFSSHIGVHQSEALRNTPPQEFIRKRIAIWKKYTVLEDDLVRKRTGKPTFFFLQPNQYLRNSKPLSEQEKQVAIDAERAERNHGIMIDLKAAAQDLRVSGVPIFDLTTIYSEIREATYKDNCCHLNELGNQIMADAVVSDITSYQRARQAQGRSAVSN